MRMFASSIAKTIAAAVALAGVTAPAMAQNWYDQGRGGYDHRADRDYGRGGYDNRYDHGGYDGRYDRGGRVLTGRGLTRLNSVLRDTPEGLRFAAQFDYNRDGRLSWEEGAEANRGLLRAADRNGDSHVSDREARAFLYNLRAYSYGY